MKKYSSITKKLIAFSCCLIMAFSFAGCSDSEKSGNTPTSSSPAKQTQSAAKATPAPTATQTNDKTAAKPTDEPTAEATQEPTEAPKPTSSVQLIENLPDYYIDLTANGYDADMLVDSFLYHCFKDDTTETGTRFTMDESNLWDPYFYFNDATMPFDDLSIPEYDYIAIRIRASRTDLKAQIRFDTVEKNRGFWYCIDFPYNDTSEWQTLVGKFTDSKFIDDPEVLNGTLKMIRIDPFDDPFDENTHESDNPVKVDDWCEIESIAFFKTAEEANAYTGLYKAD